MKFIVAYIKPYTLEDVRKNLATAGILGVTTIHATGYGKNEGHMEVYRDVEYKIDGVEKIKIEVAVSENLLAAAIHAIEQASKADSIDDGKILIFDVAHATHIRPKETSIGAR